MIVKLFTIKTILFTLKSMKKVSNSPYVKTSLLESISCYFYLRPKVITIKIVPYKTLRDMPFTFSLVITKLEGNPMKYLAFILISFSLLGCSANKQPKSPCACDFVPINQVVA